MLNIFQQLFRINENQLDLYMEKTKILDSLQISQKLNRMAYQVYENNFKEKELLIVGIEGNGYKVAEKIVAILNSISPVKTKLGKIKIDKENPWSFEPKIDFTEKDFENVVGVIVSQAMNATSCQINLLDKQIRPLETDVAMSIYDHYTKKLLHNFDHTMNGRGVPDTLFLDPMRRYDITVHTMPPVTKTNIELIVGKHNIIPIDVPQGHIQLISKGLTNYLDLKAVIKVHNKPKTINAQTFNTTKRYLTGAYDLEVLTTPRKYYDSVVVDQNKTTFITIDQPGRLQINKKSNLVAAIYQTVNGKIEWVCDISDEYFQTIIMQPGKYVLIGRSKSETRTIYTFEKEFIITSATTSELNL